VTLLFDEAFDEEVVPPFAPVLIEAMRAIGYSFQSALADIIDNSIAAGAKTVQVRFSPYDEPYVAIIDDGCGMLPDVLTGAMRHGSTDPLQPRAAADLGRFGLGLKTASLSQCRRLTVVSKVGSTISARRWDLDVISKRKDWVLLGLSENQIARLPQFGELANLETGTLVLWQAFDRLAAGELSIESAIGERMDAARSHLSLVFHRFLNPEKPVNATKLFLNDNPVAPIDPFLTSHRGTQPMPEEEITIGTEKVRVAPFILPHISKLTPADLAVAGGEEGLRRNQGFYIYRNRRLIIWGSWFRLIRQEEITKLARVRVDVPNSLDHLWTIDVKKSAAYPPQPVRDRLKNIIARITDGSRRVYTFRGRRTNGEEVVHSWQRSVTRTGIEYLINRDHPLVKALEAVTDENAWGLVHRLLRTLETTFPLDSLYADMASERRPAMSNSMSKYDELLSLASTMLDALGPSSEYAKKLIESLPSIEPFSLHPQDAALIQRKLINDYR
jgi:histidine kinase/DNA gyrase B/HSP90-like ATPase